MSFANPPYGSLVFQEVNWAVLDLLEDVPHINPDEADHGGQGAAHYQQHEHQRTPAGFQLGLVAGNPKTEHINCFDKGQKIEQPTDSQPDSQGNQ